MKKPFAGAAIFVFIALGAFAQGNAKETVLEQRRGAYLVALEKAKAEAGSLDVQLALGDAAFAAGFFDVSRKAYEQALALSPKHPTALRRLGFIHLVRNQPAEAEKDLLAAAREAPKDSRILRILTALYKWTSDFPKLIAVNEKLQKLDPEGAYIEENLIYRQFQGVKPYDILKTEDSWNIPIEFVDNLPVVPITINGHPVDALVDTAAEDIVLDLAWAKTHGLNMTPIGTGGATAGGYPMFWHGCKVDTIGIGSMTIRNVAANGQDLKGVLAGKKVPVLLGLSVLKHFIFRLDYKTMRLELYPFSKPPAAKGEGMVMVWLPDSRIIFLGSVNGCHGLPMTLDTGCGTPIVISESIRKNCKVELLDRRAAVARGLGGVFPSWFIGIQHLGLGTSSFRNVLGEMGGLTPEMEAADTMISAIVSPGALPARPSVTVDFSRMRLWVE